MKIGTEDISFSIIEYRLKRLSLIVATASSSLLIIQRFAIMSESNEEMNLKETVTLPISNLP